MLTSMMASFFGRSPLRKAWKSNFSSCCELAGVCMPESACTRWVQIFALRVNGKQCIGDWSCLQSACTRWTQVFAFRVKGKQCLAIDRPAVGSQRTSASFSVASEGKQCLVIVPAVCLTRTSALFVQCKRRKAVNWVGTCMSLPAEDQHMFCNLHCQWEKPLNWAGTCTSLTAKDQIEHLHLESQDNNQQKGRCTWSESSAIWVCTAKCWGLRSSGSQGCHWSGVSSRP